MCEAMLLSDSEEATREKAGTDEQLKKNRCVHAGGVRGTRMGEGEGR